MQIRLVHVETEKRLHSHDYRPPISDVDFQNEASAYGAPGFLGDANDNWIVEVVEGDHSDVESWKRLRTIRTHFRLRHALTGCYLFSHKVKLPEWGFEQQEVTCNKQAVKPNSLWYIETNRHPQCKSFLFFEYLWYHNEAINRSDQNESSEGQLQAPRFLRQILRVARGYVEY